MPIRRTLKNVVKNYSEAQIKVREATSNDAWGPSSTLMSEIADLTYNVVAYAEIMPIIWRRLEDTGRNWRHVYKSLVLLDYLIRNGSERVARECRERAWAIQAIADSFEFAEGADTSGQDRGAGVRERARALTALLRDDDRLRNERAKALKARERFAQNSSAVSGTTLGGTSTTKYSMRSISPLHSGSVFTEAALIAGGYSEIGSPSLSSLDANQFGTEGGTGTALESELEALRPTSAGEEELQLQLALAMSKEEHEEEMRRLKGDEAKLQMALDESRKQTTTGSSPAHGAACRPSSENVELLSSLREPAASTWALPPAGGLSSDQRLKSASPAVMPDPWCTSNPPMLPPPPSKTPQQQQSAVSVVTSASAVFATDPWSSATADANLGVSWGTQHMTTSTLSATSGSARSSPWESPCHAVGSSTNAAMFDDEFDVIGTRARSPAQAFGIQGSAPSVPPRRPLTGADGGNVSGDPWDFNIVSHSLKQDDLMNSSFQSTQTAGSFQSSPLHSQQVQPAGAARRSAQDFLGNNANLVNLDNLLSLPVSAASNPFGPSTSRSSSPAVAPAPNPFGTPPPIPSRQYPSATPISAAAVPNFTLPAAPVSALSAVSSGTMFVSSDGLAATPFAVGSSTSTAGYPQAYNPFL